MAEGRDRAAGPLIWATAFGWFAAQLLLTSARRAWSWDEAIYLSQVTPGTPALPFVASRSRGISLLVAPLAGVGVPGWAVRVTLAAGAALLLAVAFRLWVPALGTGAAIGAFLFAASWPALLYGSEVMPNLWAALLGVATAGCLLRCVTVEGFPASSRWPAALVASGACMALMRPPDAVILAAALAAGVLIWRPGARRALWPLAAGVIAGCLPWLIEMSIRSGGPVDALREAGRLGHVAGGGSGPRGQLALMDGPLLGPDAGSVHPGAALWWTGLLVAAAVAVVRWREDRGLGVRLAATGGGALALAYVLLVSGSAPRFLLPGLALLSLSAGTGVDALRRGHGWTRTATGAVAVVIAAWGIWQVSLTRTIEGRAAAERSVPAAVGEAIEELRDGASCLVLSERDYPQVAFAAGCAGRQLDGPPPAGEPARVAGQEAIFVVTRTPIERSWLEPVPSPVPGWFVARSAPLRPTVTRG